MLKQESVPRILPVECRLSKYSRVYVALDKDATDKALDIVRRLHFLVPTSLAVLPTDLKNMMDDERDEFIDERIA